MKKVEEDISDNSNETFDSIGRPLRDLRLSVECNVYMCLFASNGTICVVQY
jgi:hypothetical protein